MTVKATKQVIGLYGSTVFEARYDGGDRLPSEGATFATRAQRPVSPMGSGAPFGAAEKRLDYRKRERLVFAVFGK